jgi:hypothetical protein
VQVAEADVTPEVWEEEDEQQIVYRVSPTQRLTQQDGERGSVPSTAGRTDVHSIKQRLITAVQRPCCPSGADRAPGANKLAHRSPAQRSGICSNLFMSADSQNT